MRRAAAIALAALAAAPGAAGAQLRARPMVIPVTSAGTTVLAQPFVTPRPPGEPDLADLLLVRSGSAPSLRAHHALLSPRASPYAQPASFRCVAAGRLAQNAADASPDVVYCAGLLNELQIAFGDATTQLRSYTHALNAPRTPNVGFARLFPASLRQADVLVLPSNTGGDPSAGTLYALDFGAAAGAAPMTDRAWDATGISTRTILSEEVLTMRLSDAARASGLDDLWIAGFGSVTLYLHEAAPAGPTLADVRFLPKVKVGGSAGEGLDPSTWLPPGVANADVMGAAPLDVDLDGDLDLVVLLATSAPSELTPHGKLLWVERTSADPASLATSRPWRDLGADPALQLLVDPAFLRPLDLGGVPAAAVYDRGTDSVLVVTADRSAGRLRVWTGSAAGRQLRDFRFADVVGSAAPDLVADGTGPGGAGGPAILVWPDAGDASPELGWAPGSPGAPVRGEDLPLAVSARDPDGAFAVDWLLGDPYGAPAATTAGVAGAAFTDLAWTLGGSLLCGAPPQTVQLTVRATDAQGVFDEVAATLDVGFRAPSLALSGATPLRLELPPGGTSATLEGTAFAGCGAVSFTWGGTLFDLAHFATVQVGNVTRELVLLPESIYPALLAGPATATLVATEPATGLQSPPASVELDLDAQGLVEVSHEAGAVALAPGEVGVVRTRLRSRLSVALPQVHVVDLLAGLAPAGAPTATGATVASTSAGGAEVVLDALPPGADVTVELPVRSLGQRGTSAVEARSSGGHLLTPPAGVPGSDATPPGCGCGAGAPGGEALLALAALATRGRRRRAT